MQRSELASIHYELMGVRLKVAQAGKLPNPDTLDDEIYQQLTKTIALITTEIRKKEKEDIISLFDPEEVLR
jgi:hypothetical protein